jgi:hypothetical protein
VDETDAPGIGVEVGKRDLELLKKIKRARVRTQRNQIATCRRID